MQEHIKDLAEVQADNICCSYFVYWWCHYIKDNQQTVQSICHWWRWAGCFVSPPHLVCLNIPSRKMCSLIFSGKHEAHQPEVSYIFLSTSLKKMGAMFLFFTITVDFTQQPWLSNTVESNLIITSASSFRNLGSMSPCRTFSLMKWSWMLEKILVSQPLFRYSEP